MDTTDPPGGEKPVVDYLKQVLEAEGIPVQIFALEREPAQPGGAHQGQRQAAAAAADGPHRHRQRRPEEVDASRRSAPMRDGGYVYGRGTVDDKDNVVANLMTMLMLKRLNVPLDRDVIFLAEAGEEGTLAPRHPVHGQPALRRDRRRVLLRRRRQRHAHRRRREVRVGPDGREDSARDHRDRARRRRATARCRSRPTRSRTSARRSARSRRGRRRCASTKPPRPTSSGWPRSRRPKKRRATATCSNPDPKISGPADAYLRKNEPRHWSMLRTSLSPTMITRRLSHQRHPVRRHGDHRHAPGARRGSGEVPRAGQAGRQRSAGRGQLRRARHAAADADREARLRRVQGARSQHHQALQGDHAADDEHRRHRHGVPAPQGHAVLRHRPRARQRGRPEGLRRAQRPGAHSRKRAVSASSASTGTPSSISPAPK